MPIEAEALFKAFPEIGAAGYSQETAAFYLAEAEPAIDQKRFGRQTRFAQLLYAAHCLTIFGSAASSGSTGGSDNGRVASKSVGSASVSYDTSFGIDSEAGFWNRTKYGQMLWELMKRRRMPFVVAASVRVPSG